MYDIEQRQHDHIAQTLQRTRYRKKVFSLYNDLMTAADYVAAHELDTDYYKWIQDAKQEISRLLLKF